jgi:ABC-2 type transport system permease protein
VRSREALACLLLPVGFSGGIEGMLAGKPATIEVVVDPSRQAEAGLLTGKLMASGFRQLERRVSAIRPGWRGCSRGPGRPWRPSTNVPAPTRAALEQLYGGLGGLVLPTDELSPGTGPGGQASWQPLRIETRALQARRAGGPPSSFAVSFPQGVVWGLMSCVMAFISALIRERSRGTMLRLTAAPISATQVLAGKSLACFTCCVAVQALILAVGALGFGVTVGSPIKMVVAVLAASLGFTGLTLLMAGLSRSEEGADGLGRAALMVLAMIGGGAIPLAFMPAAMVTRQPLQPVQVGPAGLRGRAVAGLRLGRDAAAVRHPRRRRGRRVRARDAAAPPHARRMTVERGHALALPAAVHAVALHVHREAAAGREGGGDGRGQGRRVRRARRRRADGHLRGRRVHDHLHRDLQVDLLGRRVQPPMCGRGDLRIHVCGGRVQPGVRRRVQLRVDLQRRRVQPRVRGTGLLPDLLGRRLQRLNGGPLTQLTAKLQL